MSKIVNPAGKTNLFTTAGAAITDSNQPNNQQVSIAGPGTVNNDSGQLRVSSPLIDSNVISPGLIPWIQTATLGTPGGPPTENTASTSFAYTLDEGQTLNNRYGLEVGHYVLTSKGRLAQVTSVTTDVLTLNVGADDRADFFNDTIASEVLKTVDQTLIIKNREGNFVGINTTSELGGFANTALRGGASEPNRAVNNSETIRGVSIGEAIRSNYWHDYSGMWTTAPSGLNETSITNPTLDTAFSGLGRITFGYGGSPTNANYSRPYN